MVADQLDGNGAFEAKVVVVPALEELAKRAMYSESELRTCCCPTGYKRLRGMHVAAAWSYQSSVCRTCESMRTFHWSWEPAATVVREPGVGDKVGTRFADVCLEEVCELHW